MTMEVKFDINIKHNYKNIDIIIQTYNQWHKKELQTQTKLERGI